MKKILLAGVLLSSVFGLSLEERVKILEDKVAKLEKKLNMVDKSQKEIIKTGIVKNCNNLKLVNYSYQYNNGGFIKTYDFKYTFKNNYAKDIKYVYGSVSFYDNENTQLLEDYIKKNINIPSKKEVVIKTNYLVSDGDLAEYVKDTPKKDLKLEFKPFTIIFKDGQKLKCN